MSDEETLLKLQQLVAITQMLQACFTTKMAIDYLLEEKPFKGKSKLYDNLIKDASQLVEDLWSYRNV